MASAESVAKSWTSRKAAPEKDDLKGLPANVQEAVLAVVAASVDLGERVALAEELHGVDPTHELALDPESHTQSTRAYRFEEVGEEIVEIRKESHDAPVTITYRPELAPPDYVDPLSALQARLQASEPVEG